MEIMRMCFIMALVVTTNAETTEAGNLTEMVIQSIQEAILMSETDQSDGPYVRKAGKSAMPSAVTGCTLWQHSLFSSASGNSGRVPQTDRNAALSISALRKFNVRSRTTGPKPITTDEALLQTWRSQIASKCTPSPQPMSCSLLDRYRTANGTCNNIQNPLYGSSHMPHRRLLPPEYDDGIDSPRTRAENGSLLPSPRLISNTLHSSSTSWKSPSFTIMYMSFGQFLDHDITSTPSMKDENNNPIDCCQDNNVVQNSACFPIGIPDNDERFVTKCMSFTRSAAAVNNGCDPDYRQQINQLTSYIDASNVYGSYQETQDRLRTKSEGRMRVSVSGDLLPSYNSDTCVLTDSSSTHCFDAGDERHSEVPTLTTLHIAFLREHNRIADQLHQLNPDWNDEQIFQETRKIVGALLQHITYNEYLPIVLGNDLMEKFDLRPSPSGFRHVYNDTIDATSFNAFATAAFRYGHSQIPDQIMLLNQRYKKKEIINVESHFFKPDIMFKKHGPEWLGRWQVSRAQRKEDKSIQGSVRNFLFLDSKNDSLDLAALNMQRGRDHGLPSYNAWRTWCGLEQVTHFGYRKGGLIDHSQYARKKIASLYSSPNDIDLYSGGLSENRILGGLVGPTFACILSQQFNNLQKGDRFWYENDAPNSGFTEAQLNEIKKMTLSSILCTNLNLIKTQRNSFRMKNKSDNTRQECSQLPSIDMTKWAITQYRHY
ncbi:chorion peroxidase-like isoform X2 [Argopecten irradians]